MRTTVDLPDELHRAVKVAAAREGRSVKDLVIELLRRGLEHRDASDDEAVHRVELPLLVGRPGAAGMPPGQIAQVLDDDEVDGLVA